MIVAVIAVVVVIINYKRILNTDTNEHESLDSKQEREKSALITLTLQKQNGLCEKINSRILSTRTNGQAIE